MSDDHVEDGTCSHTEKLQGQKEKGRKSGLKRGRAKRFMYKDYKVDAPERKVTRREYCLKRGESLLIE
jgi:hypothetical protein